MADRAGLALAALIYVIGVLAVVTTGSGRTASTSDGAATQDVPAAVASADTPQSARLARHSIAFPLKPGESFEFKYRLDKGAALVYTWSASGPLKFDLHSEGEDARTEQSHRTGEDRSASGVFTAPLGGIHGWYWENAGTTPVHVTLTTSGFYTAALEIRPTGPIEHTLQY